MTITESDRTNGASMPPTDEPSDRMPPPESGKHLTDAERDVLARWIAQGDTSQPLSAQAGKIVRVFCHGAIGARAAEAGVAST